MDTMVDISTRFELLELVRRAAQADAAHQAAIRRAARAATASADALDALVDRIEILDRTTGGEEERRAAADAAEAARSSYIACGERKAQAQAKVRRTFAAGRAADRVLGALYARHARGRAACRNRGEFAAALLGELAAAPHALLRAADACLLQTSSGKDSLAGMDQVVRWADAADCRDKLVVVHADLGQAEWPGVRELAQRQAERYGLRFVEVRADVTFLDLVERRGMFPDAQRRLCTASLKRAPAAPVITEVVAALGLDRQAIVLNAMGIRAAESPARGRKQPLAIDLRASSGKRLVLTWYPIFEWSETAVWQRIADAALEYHDVYDALLPRLSCVLCVLAGRELLVRAARLCIALGLTHLPQRYVEMERRTGHSFKRDVSIAEIWSEAQRRECEEGPLVWRRGDALRHHLGEEAAQEYLAARTVLRSTGGRGGSRHTGTAAPVRR